MYDLSRLRPKPRRASPAATHPDLQTQFEDLLGAVRAGEANWRLDDRIDLALRTERLRRSLGFLRDSQ